MIKAAAAIVATGLFFAEAAVPPMQDNTVLLVHLNEQGTAPPLYKRAAMRRQVTGTDNDLTDTDTVVTDATGAVIDVTDDDRVSTSVPQQSNVVDAAAPSTTSGLYYDWTDSEQGFWELTDDGDDDNIPYDGVAPVAGAGAVADNTNRTMSDPTYNAKCSSKGANGQKCGVDADHICNMTLVGEAGCGLANITGNTRVNIVTGGETQCLNSSSEYFFHVTQASTSKLFIWFQDGGACWGNNITSDSACAANPEKRDFVYYASVNPVTYTGGIFNRTEDDDDDDDKNDVDLDDVPFEDYTMVQVPYCSGDFHVGNTVRTYVNETTGEVIEEVNQKGAKNVEAVLKWVFENYGQVSKLVIGGCSSGAIGAQAWSGYVYQHYKTARPNDMPRMAVVLDSFTGIYPENFREILRDYNASAGAWASALPEDSKQKLSDGQLHFCEVASHFQATMSNATFAAVQGAYDKVQTRYYNALARGANASYVTDETTPECARDIVPVLDDDDDELNGANYTALFAHVQKAYEGYMSRGARNFVPFLINSTNECFLARDDFRSVQVLDFVTGKNITLSDWLDDIESLEDDDDLETDDNEDFYPICDKALPCDTLIFNTTVVPVDKDD